MIDTHTEARREWLRQQQSAVADAKDKFKQPFAHEPGATWKPNPVPVLTRWLMERKSA